MVRQKYNDLDGNQETLAGYRSVLSGGVPDLHGCTDWGAEREAIVMLIDSWDDIPHEQIAICVPTNQMASEAATTLAEHGIRSVEIGPDGPRGDGGVHLGTMFRFKGLEYQRMVDTAAGSSHPGTRVRASRRNHQSWSLWTTCRAAGESVSPAAVARARVLVPAGAPLARYDLMPAARVAADERLVDHGVVKQPHLPRSVLSRSHALA